jgi:hypothetical protein
MTEPLESMQFLLQSMQSLYGEPHVFRQVDPKQFPWVKHKFYNQSQGQLEQLGFQKIADLEDVTVNQTNPQKSRTFIRAMVGDTGTVLAGIYHFPSHVSSLMTRALLFLLRISRHSYIVDFETEFANGVFLVTSNTEMASAIQMDVPELQQHFFPKHTSVEDLYKSHRAMLNQIIKNSGAQPLSINTFEELEASQHRLQALKNGYRQSVGFLTAEDIDRTSAGRFDQAAEVMKQALEQTQAPDR